jgi:SAM-dependent methyltransferase
LVCGVEGRWFATDQGVHRLLTEERRRELRATVEIQARAFRDDAAGVPSDPARLRQALALAREKLPRRPLTVLEVGARTCEASLLALADGDSVAAVGLDVDDGLRQAVPPPRGFLVRAEGAMDCIPLEAGLADLVIAQGALHYALRPVRALVEIRRVTRRGGWLLVIDTPVFADRAQGEAWVAERMRVRSARYRFPVPREMEAGYLVAGELRETFRASGWILEVHGWPTRLARWLGDARARLVLGRAEPRTPVLLARRDS